MLDLTIHSTNRALIDSYLDKLLPALDAYRPTRRHRMLFDTAAQHYRTAKVLVHRQTKEAEIAAALREIDRGNHCLWQAKYPPEKLLRRMHEDWEKSLGRR